MKQKSLYISHYRNLFGGILRLVIFSLLLTFMLFFLTFTRLTHGAEVPRIAVYYFSNQTGTEEWEWLERGMADMLERTFSQSEKLHCITLSEIDQAVDREKFEGLSESKELSFFQSLNNLLKVDTIFTGNFSMNTQGEIRFNLLMYQSQLNELFEFREEVSPPDDLLEIKEKFAEVIMREMDIAIDEELALLLNKNISSSIPALKAYYQAIEFKNKAIQEYQGIDFPSKPLWSKAIDYGEKAVSEDPDFSDAYYLLAEIYERTKWTIREIQSLEKFIETADNNTYIQVSYEELSESLYRLAYSKYSQGEINAAIDYLEDSIAYNSNNIQARTYLMKIYYQVGQASKALQQAEEIKKIEPDNRELDLITKKSEQAATYGKEAFESYENGYHAYIDKNYMKAIQLLEHAIDLNPDFKNAHYYLALSYYHYGNLDAAIQHWEETIRLDPFDNHARIYLSKAKEEKEYGRDVIWRFNEGYKHYIAGEYEEALTEFKTVTDSNPNFGKARMFLMRTYHHLDQMDEYLAERKKITESKAFSDDWEEEYYLLAYDFFSIGQYDIALENLREALEINPDYLEARFLMAEILFQLDRFDESILHYQYIIDNYDHYKESEYYDDALLGGGWNAYLLEDYTQSQKYLRLLVEEYPKSSLYQEGMHKLGRVYFEQEEYRQTIDIYEELLEMDSLQYDVSEIHYFLGQSYFWIENYSKAKELLADIIENDPDFDFIDETKYFYSFSLFREERYDEALEVLEELSSSEKSAIREEARYLLGRTLLELKEYDRVITVNQSLLKTDINDDMRERVLFDLGLSYSRKGSDEDAALYFRRVVNEYPERELARLSRIELAQSYYNLGEYQDVLTVLENIDSREALDIKIDSARKLNEENLLLSLYEELREKYPDESLSLEEHFSLAKSQFEEEEYQDAIDTFKLMENMESSEEMSSEINYWQGLSYYRLEEYQLANDYFQRNYSFVGEEDDIIIRSLYMLAETYYQQKDYAQAIDFFEKFLENYDSHSLAEHVYYSIGWSYLNIEDYSDALSVFASFEESYPDSKFLEESQFLVGKIQFLTEDNDNSKTHLVDFIKKYPESQYREEAIYIIAQISLEEQQWIDSITYFERLIDEYPDSKYLAGSLYGLSLSHFKGSEYEKALEAGDSYLNSYPSGSFVCDILYITAICLEELDDIAKASERYEKIVSDCPESTYLESARKQLEKIDLK